MRFPAKCYVALVITLGLLSLGVALADWGSIASLNRMAVYVTVTAIASAVKLRLPGLHGTYSLSGVLLLAGAVHFTLPEVVLAAVASALVQSLVRAECQPSFIQILFNIANETICIALASVTLSYLVREGIWPFRPALLAAAAAIYFVLNTGLVSGILSLLGGEGFFSVNKQWYSWSFPYYLLGAALVGAVPLDGGAIDIEACAVLVPLAYLTHFFSGLADRRRENETADAAEASAIPASAKAFTGVVAATAASLVAVALSRGDSPQWVWFVCYLVLAILTATWKVRLPGTNGTISVHYVVMLVAIAQASMAEALAISAAGPLVQSLWRAKARPQPVQILFNVATMMVATGVTFSLCRILPGAGLQASVLALLAVAAVLHFLTNTTLVAVVISLVEKEPVFALWRRLYFWAFPIYMVGAAAAAVMVATTRTAGWVPSLFILPLMAMIQFSYRLHVVGYFQLAPQHEGSR